MFTESPSSKTVGLKVANAEERKETGASQSFVKLWSCLLQRAVDDKRLEEFAKQWGKHMERKII